MLRNPDFIQKVDNVKIQLNTPIPPTSNGSVQKKTGYEFYSRSKSRIYDWYNAVFFIRFRLEKLDGGEIGSAVNACTANGGFSLIKNLKVKTQKGQKIYSCRECSKLIFIKKLLDFSNDYSGTTGAQNFWYLDKARNLTNDGTQKRVQLLKGSGLIAETRVLLNSFSFFENLFDRFLPPMDLSFEIDLQDDDELIYRGGSDALRVIVKDFTLKVPSLHLTPEGQQIFNENYLQPQTLTFLQESIAYNNPSFDSSGYYTFSQSSSNVQHVFVFFQNDNARNSQTKNPYLFDTFNLGQNNVKLINCHLKYGDDQVPSTAYDGDDLISDILAEASGFNYRNYDYNTGSQLNPAYFRNNYPFIYFDLRPLNKRVSNESQALTFYYTLNDTPTNDKYRIYACYLEEKKIVVKIDNGEVVVL